MSGVSDELLASAHVGAHIEWALDDEGRVGGGLRAEFVSDVAAVNGQ